VKPPIYIVGTERSGSNLLRLILDAHPHIAVPHPPHFLRYFARLEAGYGDLSDPRHLGRLADHMLRLLSVHIHPWELTIDRERLLAEARPRDLLGLNCAFYEQYMAAMGKVRWADKSTFVIHHLDRVLARDPGAKLIWLIRDPRDVAVSSRESVFNPWHPYLTARLWSEQQRLGAAALAAHGPGSVHRMHYESLIALPEPTLRHLFDFLDEPWDEGVLRFFEGRSARRIARLSRDWANAGRPILSDNSGKYRKALSAEEIGAVEMAAGEPMARLGYPLEQPAQVGRRPTPAQLLRWRISDQLDRARVEWRSAREDQNHWRRWLRGAYVAALPRIQ
jgi:hypothetical protein